MILFIIKSSACLILLFVFYKAFLENENLHVFKRVYLLVMILISFIIPFITFQKQIELPIEFLKLDSFGHNNSISVNQTQIVNYSNYVFIIYISGIILLGGRFIKNLRALFVKVRRNKKYKVNSYTLVLLNEDIAPYSFLGYIFVDAEKFKAKQIASEIMLHEQAHITQKHSLDILFIEFLQVVFWFNPLFLYVKKAIKLNHEFLADSSVLKKGTCVKSYQQSLLKFSSYLQQINIASAVNYSFVKKRFLIMTKKRNKTTVSLKLFFVLPLLSFLIFSFSNVDNIQYKNKADFITSNETTEKVNEVSPNEKVSAIPEIYYLMKRNTEFIYNNKTITHSEVRELIKSGLKLNFTVQNLKTGKLIAKLSSSDK